MSLARERQRSPSEHSSWAPSTGSATSDQASEHYSTYDSSSALDPEQWSLLARALGISTSDEHVPNLKTGKLAHKISKAHLMSAREMTAEVVTNVLLTVAAPHPRMLIATSACFHRDAVPVDLAAGLGGLDCQWTLRLAAPRPRIALGYNPRVFSCHYVELQQGIIADPRGEPRDLGRIAESVDGLYWPFLVVDVSDKSMAAARSGCAGATATCNNALMILAGALIDPKHSHYDPDLITSLSTAVHSFSLAIHGKTACLMTHNSDASVAEAVGIVRSYALDREADLDALARRIRSILLWGQGRRLQAIMDLLARLDRRVNFTHTASSDQESACKLPLELAASDAASTPRKRKGKKAILESVLADTMPSWSRAQV